MHQRKLTFWAGQLVGPAIFTGLAIADLARRDWWGAVVDIVFIAACGIHVANVLVWHRIGYRRGMDDFAGATIRAQSPEEFLRLTVYAPAPKPWR